MLSHMHRHNSAGHSRSITYLSVNMSPVESCGFKDFWEQAE